MTKNINLNDSTSEEIREYYSSLNSLANSERTGTNLLKNLKPILKNNQKYYSYDSGNAIWQMYEITDRDWDKSPASEISGYNASTNTITGYTYGTSLNNKGSNPYIHALYNNREVENETRAWDSHGKRENAWTIEREHIWPKSQGFEAEGAGGARGDPMHLWAANGTTNGLHSQLFYGNVDRSKSVTDSGSTHPNTAGNLTGTSKTVGSGTVFEPQDSDKGDIARAVFYMVARYNYLSGSDADGISADNPNLELVSTSKYAAKYTSTTTNTGKLGIVEDLLEWNKLDPVDEYEIHRNNLLFNNYTNNRNPFIDFPEWADIIWGEDKDVKWADPTSDGINGSKIILKTEDDKTFNPTSLNPDESYVVKVNADAGTSVKWTVDDETILNIEEATSNNVGSASIKYKKTETLDSGKKVILRALKVGTTKLTIECKIDGKDEKREISVSVKEKSVPQEQENLLEKILKNPLYIAIGIAVIVFLIVLLIVFFSVASKKQKRKVKNTVKKNVKKTIKKSNGKK